MTDDYKYDIKKLVGNMFETFPNLKYIAINASLSELNQFCWSDEWYMVGFEEEPYLKLLDGYPMWVADKKMMAVTEETGFFFMHFKSPGFYFENTLLQSSDTEFMDETDLCFCKVNGEVVQWKNEDHIIKTIEIEDENSEFKKILEEMV